MIAIDPARLGARDRARLIDALAAPPLLASPATVPLAAIVVWGAIALGAIAWAAARVELFAPGASLGRDTLVLTALAASAAAIVSGVALAVARAGAIARTPWPVGRFVHRFGVVIADVHAIEILEGRDLAELRVDVGPVDRDGARDVIVSAVAARSGVVTTVRARGTDASTAPLDDVRGGRWQVLEGYRDTRAVVSSGSARARRRIGTVLIPIAAALAAAALVSLGLVPRQAIALARTSPAPLQRWAEIERTFPLPWIAPVAATAIEARRAAIATGIEDAFAEPFRTALLDWLASAPPGEAPALELHAVDCNIDRDERDGVISWLAAHAHADAEVPFFRSRIGGAVEELLAAAIPPDATVPSSAPARLAIACTPRPRDVVQVRDRPVAWLAMEIRWSLEIPGRPPLVGRTEVEPPSEAGILARLPLDAPPDALGTAALREWERATEDQIGRVVLGALAGATPSD